MTIKDMIYRQAAIDALEKDEVILDFLADQFDISRTTAKGMLHGLMRGKAEDNFKKQFSGEE